MTMKEFEKTVVEICLKCKNNDLSMEGIRRYNNGESGLFAVCDKINHKNCKKIARNK